MIGKERAAPLARVVMWAGAVVRRCGLDSAGREVTRGVQEFSDKNLVFPGSWKVPSRVSDAGLSRRCTPTSCPHEARQLHLTSSHLPPSWTYPRRSQCLPHLSSDGPQSARDRQAARRMMVPRHPVLVTRHWCQSRSMSRAADGALVAAAGVFSILGVAFVGNSGRGMGGCGGWAVGTAAGWLRGRSARPRPCRYRGHHIACSVLPLTSRSRS